MLKLVENELGPVRSFLDEAPGGHGALLCSEMSLFEFVEGKWVDISRQLSLDDVSLEQRVTSPRIFVVVDHPDDRHHLSLGCTDGVFSRATEGSKWERVGQPPAGLGESGSFPESETGEMRATPPARALSLSWFRVSRRDGSQFWSLFLGTDTDLYYLSAAGYWAPYAVKPGRGGTWSEMSLVLKTIRGYYQDWLLVGSRSGLSLIGHDLTRHAVPVRDALGTEFYLSEVINATYRQNDKTLFVVAKHSANYVVARVSFGAGLDQPTQDVYDPSSTTCEVLSAIQSHTWNGFEKLEINIDGRLHCTTGSEVFVFDEEQGLWTALPSISDGVYSSLQLIMFDHELCLCLGTANGNVLTRPSGKPWRLRVDGLLPQPKERLATSSELTVWGVQHVRRYDPDCFPEFDADEIPRHFRQIVVNVIFEQPVLAAVSGLMLLSDLYNRWVAYAPTAPFWREGYSNCVATFALVPDGAIIKSVLLQARGAHGPWRIVDLVSVRATPTNEFVPWARWDTDVVSATSESVPPFQMYGHVFKSWTPDIVYFARFTVKYELP